MRKEPLQGCDRWFDAREFAVRPSHESAGQQTTSQRQTSNPLQQDWNQVVSKIGDSQESHSLIQKEGLQMISATSLRKRILCAKRKMETMEGRERIKAEVHWLRQA